MIFSVSGREKPRLRKKLSRSSSLRATICSRAALIPARNGAGDDVAKLSSAGAAYQGLFRNPLVSPEVLGISQGAAFGGALAITLGIWGLGLLGTVFVFGLLALVLVGLLARVDGRTEIITVILSGMVIGSLLKPKSAVPT